MNHERIFEYVEGRLSPTERASFEQAMMADAELRAEVEAAKKIAHGFTTLRAIPVAPDLLADTRRKIEVQKFISPRAERARRDHPLRWLWTVGATVAVVVLAALTYWEYSGPRVVPELASNQTAEKQKEIPPPASATSPTGSIVNLAAIDDDVAVDNRANQIMKIANDFGGTASREKIAAREERVLAYIPQSQVENFRRRLEGSELAQNRVTVSTATAIISMPPEAAAKVDASNALSKTISAAPALSPEPPLVAGTSNGEIWDKSIAQNKAAGFGIASGAGFATNEKLRAQDETPAASATLTQPMSPALGGERSLNTPQPHGMGGAGGKAQRSFPGKENKPAKPAQDAATKNKAMRDSEFAEQESAAPSELKSESASLKKMESYREEKKDRSDLSKQEPMQRIEIIIHPPDRNRPNP